MLFFSFSVIFTYTVCQHILQFCHGLILQILDCMGWMILDNLGDYTVLTGGDAVIIGLGKFVPEQKVCFTKFLKLHIASL